MRKLYFIILFNCFYCASISCQNNYTGQVGKSQVEFLIDHNKAVYKYDKYDTPILLKGDNNDNRLRLFEFNKKNDTIASLIFKNYNTNNEKIVGVWNELRTNKKLKIKLNKTGNDTLFLQKSNTKDHYFKVKKTDNLITDLMVYSKGNDQLIQDITTSCEIYWDGPIFQLEISDYNNDGNSDFSLHQTLYAKSEGRDYYFYNPNTKIYEYGFEGAGLEFVNGHVFQSDIGYEYSYATNFIIVDNELVTTHSTELALMDGGWDIVAEYSYDEKGNKILFYSNADSTHFNIYIPYNLEKYDSSMNDFLNNKELGNPLWDMAFIQKNISIPFTNDTSAVIKACANAAAASISPFGNDVFSKVTYFKIHNKTAYVLLDAHQEGWAGSWAFIGKMEPIIERSIIKFNQINNVVFDFAPMDKKNEH